MTWRSPIVCRLDVPNDGQPGTFGFVRKHHIHEGVDLYCPEGTLVSAVENGVVVAVIPFTGEHAIPPSPWWHNTDAVLVEGRSGVVVYGEISSNVRVNEFLLAGDVIGRVKTVLKKDKGRPMSMLHLELHTHGTRNAFDWLLNEPKPPSLRDPTHFLRTLVIEKLLDCIP